MKLLSILLLLPTFSLASPTEPTYQIKLETTVPGKPTVKETIDLVQDAKHPFERISRFYDTKDGTYLIEFFPPRNKSIASENKKIIWLPVIAGKLPDPKVGSSLNELEYGFDQIGETITVFQNDPANPKMVDLAHPTGFLYEMKIQLLSKN